MLIGNRYRRVSGRHRNKGNRCPATLKTRWLPTPFLTRQIIHCHCNCCCIHSYCLVLPSFLSTVRGQRSGGRCRGVHCSEQANTRTKLMADSESGSQQFPHFGTQAIHAGQEPEQWKSKAVVPPISLSTTFKQNEPGKPVRQSLA